MKIQNGIACISENLDAFEIVKKRCMIQAEKMYGSPLPQTILSRLQWELEKISLQNCGKIFTVAMDLVAGSQSRGVPVGVRGETAASLVAFFCGISEINPLEPHYICPVCKCLEFWGDRDMATGLDLPDTCCSRCGNPMKKDGFGLTAETCYGIHGEKPITISLNFSEDDQALAVAHLRELVGKERVCSYETLESEGMGWFPGRYKILPDGFVIDVLGHNTEQLLKELHLATGVSPLKIPLDDKKPLTQVLNKENCCFGDLIQYLYDSNGGKQAESQEKQSVIKARATAYALQEFRLAWYKTYYPHLFCKIK